MTIAISFRFLGVGFHATPWGHHVNEGALEWPPSPWRLVRAIAAGLARARPETSQRELREGLLPFLEPPVYWLPPAAAAHTRHYMPGKDARDLVFDTFVLPERGQPLVAMWPSDVDGSAQLDAALVLISYIGRSQSWVVAERSEPREPNAAPIGWDVARDSAQHELVRLLAPDPNAPDRALEGLLLGTDEVRSRRLAIPPGSRWLEYTRPAIIADPLPRHDRGQAVTVSLPTVARYLVDSPAAPPITEAILVADLARRAVMAWYGRYSRGMASPILAGKDAAGTPLEGHRHAFYLPTDEDGDRRIDHLTIVAQDGFSIAEQEALARAQTLEPGRGRPTVRLVLLGFGGTSAFHAPLLEPARVWRSHTPFIPVRHLKIRNTTDGKQVVDGPIDQLLLELSRRGYPRPTRVRAIRGARWLEFRLHRPRQEPPGAALGFEIEFSEPVAGPIALGRSCHFGLGTFLPA